MFDKIKDIIFKIKDYDRLEHDYACILDYITDGRLSKTNYRVEGLYTVIDDILTERDECTRKEVEKEIIEKMKKQPEVNFKIEERKWVHNAVDNVFPVFPEYGDFMSEVDFRKILKATASHFYKLGLNTKKEE